MIKSLTWHLFERMQLAAHNNNAINKKDFLLLQQKKSNSKIITLTDNNITEVHINEAIEQLRKTGGEIRVGEGVCEFSQSLCIPTGISLSGILDRTDFVFNNIDYAIQIQGSVTELTTDVSIKNIRLFHRGNHTFCACVLITHTERVHFENVTIASPRAIGFLLADCVYNTTFLNCVVHHAGLVGFMLVRDVRETLLKDCRAEYCQQSGIFLTDLKLPEHIDALDFEKQLHHTDYLIGNFAPFSISDPSPYRTDLINCVFSHNRKMGITTDGVGYLSVKNCIIAHNDCEGITIDNGSWGCSITACHIYNNGWRGYQHEVELGIDFVDVVGLMPDGSSKAKLPGISIDNAAFTRIENNHIECNWGDGIKMVRAVYASSLCHNLIEHNNRGVNDKFHYFGVLVGVSSRQHPDQDDFPSCNNQMIGNDILGGHFAGIHLMLGVSGNIVERNQIYGATFAAIEDHNMPGNVVLPPLNNR